MIYLDNSATTQAIPAAVEAAQQYMSESFFNPAAAYSPAVESERAVNGARARLASAMNAGAEEIIFTSGGTESNNMAIRGSLGAMRGRGRVVVSAVEHPSVYEPARGLAPEYEVAEAGVDGKGCVDVGKLSQLITPSTRLVSIMQVNNETGAINDIPAIYRLVKREAPGALLHVDGVQGFLKAPFDARNCDLYTISGHKFHGPKGVGALYVKKGTRFLGGQTGGGQEKNLRSGTTNTPGIMGMDAALQYSLANQDTMWQNMRACKLRFVENLASLPDVLVNGPAPAEGAPHILNMSFLGVRGEVLLHALAEKKIYVSTGSACSARKKGKNRVLNAMGVTGERQEGAIRFSFSAFNTPAEMDAAAAAIADLLGQLRRFRRR